MIRVSLIATARRLWPDSRPNQARWLHAIRIVRRTAAGWVLERSVERSRG